jgi:hypothetical protein
MGDAGGTVKRFYVQTLEPGMGKRWFNLPADLAKARLPGIRQAYVEIMDILETRMDEAVSAK